MINSTAKAGKSLCATANIVNSAWLAQLFLSLMMGLITCVQNASADDSLHIAIIGDSSNANQLLLSDNAKATLDKLGLQLKISSLDSGPFIKANGCNEDYDLVIPVGNDISKKLIESKCPLPMISVLTPSFSYYKIDQQDAQLSSIFLDQPASRYLAMVKALSSNIRHVSLIYSDYSERFYQQLMESASSNGLTIKAMKIDDDSNLYRTLEQVTEETDILLAVPDPYVYNRKTIKAIFLASYQSGVPIIGFSAAYTKAGAIASIHSDIEHIAKQLAESIYAFYQNDHKLPKESYPEHFEISTNNKVANSLGLNIGSATEIQHSITEAE